jgi:hypothetical protein
VASRFVEGLAVGVPGLLLVVAGRAPTTDLSNDADGYVIADAVRILRQHRAML